MQPSFKVSVSSNCSLIVTGNLNNKLISEVCVIVEMECEHGSVCMSRLKYQGEHNWREARSGEAIDCEGPGR